LIFVTVGTQKFQFNRLFNEIESLILKGAIKEEVIAQVGPLGYSSKLFKVVNFINPVEFEQYLDQSWLVITHGGTSSIIKSLEREKKVIVVPRLKEFNEHVDNHQVEITDFFSSEGYIEPVYDINYLGKAINNSVSKQYKSYHTNNKSPLFKSIKNYLEELGVRKINANAKG